MTAAVGENYDAWESKIPEVQCGINGTVNSTTDRLGNLDLARQSAALNKAKLMKKNFDKKRLEPIQYNVGDMVLVERTPMIKGLSSGKLVQKFAGPVQVTHVLGNDRYRVQSLLEDGPRGVPIQDGRMLEIVTPKYFSSSPQESLSRYVSFCYINLYSSKKTPSCKFMCKKAFKGIHSIEPSAISGHGSVVIGFCSSGDGSYLQMKPELD
ncbi:hypothetical protein NQ318_011530 [Aromia moschata]|uniref:Uncharacterized protein n=1 Tax=Aromia moschata TaxID=1265417 RepID=A0AAV8Z7M5_9CUCU|nr:hypothetical protein NQ318_011530 [Aromia moschata]